MFPLPRSPARDVLDIAQVRADEDPIFIEIRLGLVNAQSATEPSLVAVDRIVADAEQQVENNDRYLFQYQD